MSWTKHYDYSSSVHLRSNEKWRRKEEYLLNEGTYGIEKWVPSRTGKAVEFHTAPKKWSLISSRQTHQPRNVQNVSKDYHLFLEKPSLKVFGKITHNFHPLRPLLPLFSVSCTSPELLAPLHHHLNTLKALLIGGEKPKSEAGPVFSPRPLQQQHYLLPHFPRETCWKRVCHAPSPSQASTLSHLAFALPAAQNQRSIKSPTTGWFSWHFDTADSVSHFLCEPISFGSCDGLSFFCFLSASLAGLSSSPIAQQLRLFLTLSSLPQALLPSLSAVACLHSDMHRVSCHLHTASPQSLSCKPKYSSVRA